MVHRLPSSLRSERLPQHPTTFSPIITHASYFGQSACYTIVHGKPSAAFAYCGHATASWPTSGTPSGQRPCSDPGPGKERLAIPDPAEREHLELSRYVALQSTVLLGRLQSVLTCTRCVVRADAGLRRRHSVLRASSPPQRVVSLCHARYRLYSTYEGSIPCCRRVFAHDPEGRSKQWRSLGKSW